MVGSASLVHLTHWFALARAALIFYKSACTALELMLPLLSCELYTWIHMLYNRKISCTTPFSIPSFQFLWRLASYHSEILCVATELLLST